MEPEEIPYELLFEKIEREVIGYSIDYFDQIERKWIKGPYYTRLEYALEDSYHFQGNWAYKRYNVHINYYTKNKDAFLREAVEPADDFSDHWFHEDPPNL